MKKITLFALLAGAIVSSGAASAQDFHFSSISLRVQAQGLNALFLFFGS